MTHTLSPIQVSCRAMSFTSWQYPLFLALVVLLFWQLRGRARFWLILGASFVFYGAWDLRFIALILAAASIDFLCTSALDNRPQPWWIALTLSLLPAGWLLLAMMLTTLRTIMASAGAGSKLLTNMPTDMPTSMPTLLPTKLALIATVAGLLFTICYAICIRQTDPLIRRRWLLLLAIAGNLAILATFKYANFFLDNLQASLRLLGVSASWSSLEIILPVGVSFHTFQSIAYAVDVYRRKLPAERSYGRIVLMICFFPQMVAGPIERAAQILPQLRLTQPFTRAHLLAALHLLLVGYFLKVFVADNCAVVANFAFNSLRDAQTLNGQWLLLGTFAFAMQIYGDFAGYSYIARGSSLLLGVQLARNFANPYLAVSASDFWRRWHLSLSQWIRDYLYIPLGGNRASVSRTTINLWLTMLLAGLWHGSTWMFVLWGAYHALLLSIGRFIPAKRALPKAIAIPVMFVLTCIGWFIFRSTSPADMMRGLIALGNWSSVNQEAVGAPFRWVLVHSLPALLLLWLTRRQTEDAQFATDRQPMAIALIYVLMLVAILTAGGPDVAFIYFQF